MYRRIELIESFKNSSKDYIHGLCGCVFGEGGIDIFDAWADDMPGPKGKGTQKNCRYFFTEYGWNTLGIATIDACQKHDHKYRIIKVKEKSVDVVYQDKYQVAVRPRKKK